MPEITYGITEQFNNKHAWEGKVKVVICFYVANLLALPRPHKQRPLETEIDYSPRPAD